MLTCGDLVGVRSTDLEADFGESVLASTWDRHLLILSVQNQSKTKRTMVVCSVCEGKVWNSMT